VWINPYKKKKKRLPVVVWIKPPSTDSDTCGTTTQEGFGDRAEDREGRASEDHRQRSCDGRIF
jgi:hypothetical protein